MYSSSVSVTVVLTAVRLFLGGMIFAHGFNKVFRGGGLVGTASWFDGIGMRPGKINAVLAAVTEMGVGVLLVAGLATTLAAGGLIAVMAVAIVTVHWRNGFFIFNKGQGIEYCLCVAIVALVPATLGPGRVSVDYLSRHSGPFRWASNPTHGLVVAVVSGIGAATVLLASSYRPTRETS